MSENTLFCKRFHATKERKAEALERDDLPNHSDAVKEHRAMAVDSQYTDSESVFNKNKCEHWQPIGDVAARLVEKMRQERQK